ncbi:hypothetical protein ACH5RR_039124 [Cinchona calisaya]|uniref:Uncharacterized protein n=1 Tax=Cinchona calisaya TaxID=153742 RepID=A0ABD2XXB2_9GENT
MLGLFDLLDQDLVLLPARFLPSELHEELDWEILTAEPIDLVDQHKEVFYARRTVDEFLDHEASLAM